MVLNTTFNLTSCTDVDREAIRVVLERSLNLIASRIESIAYPNGERCDTDILVLVTFANGTDPTLEGLSSALMSASGLPPTWHLVGSPTLVFINGETVAGFDSTLSSHLNNDVEGTIVTVTMSGFIAILLIAFAVYYYVHYQRKRKKVFLSYRVASDKEHVERLYELLVERGIDVWWDKKCLQDAEQWEAGFAMGLFSSQIFVPVMSTGGLANFATLDSASPRDNVLLEYVLALEQIERRQMLGIFPVFVGPLDATTGMHANFFAAGGLPNCTSLAPVNQVDDAAREHLSNKHGPLKGGLLVRDRSARSVLKQVISYQGGFVQGDHEAALVAIADRIAAVVKKHSGGSTAVEGEDCGPLPQGITMRDQEGVEMSAIVVRDDGRPPNSDVLVPPPARSRWPTALRRFFMLHRRARAPESMREHADDVAMLPPPPRASRRKARSRPSATEVVEAGGAPQLLRGYFDQTAAAGEERGAEMASNPVMLHEMSEQIAQDRLKRGLSGRSGGLGRLQVFPREERSEPVDVEGDKFTRLSRWLQTKRNVSSSPGDERGGSGIGSDDSKRVSLAAAEAHQRLSHANEQRLVQAEKVRKYMEKVRPHEELSEQ